MKILPLIGYALSSFGACLLAHDHPGFTMFIGVCLVGSAFCWRLP